MKQVFISYSTKDFNQALAVRHVLEQNGITCWMAPADIPGGSNYTKEIPLAIRGCQAFVLMLSGNAQKSRWVLKELDNAVNEGKIILPFQLEDVPLSDEFNFLLTGAQRYAAYQRKAEALNLLVNRIKAIIGTEENGSHGSGTADGNTPAEPATPGPEARYQVLRESPVKRLFGGLGQNQDRTNKRNYEVQSNETCPACGSIDVVEFPNQIKPVTATERILHIVLPLAGVMVLPFVSSLVLFVISIAVNMLIDDPDVLEFFGFLAFLSWIPVCVLGFLLGRKAAEEQTRRQRIQKHTEVKECRCNHCRKAFQTVMQEEE